MISSSGAEQWLSIPCELCPAGQGIPVPINWHWRAGSSGTPRPLSTVMLIPPWKQFLLSIPPFKCTFCAIPALLHSEPRSLRFFFLHFCYKEEVLLRVQWEETNNDNKGPSSGNSFWLQIRMKGKKNCCSPPRMVIPCQDWSILACYL